MSVAPHLLYLPSSYSLLWVIWLVELKIQAKIPVFNLLATLTMFYSFREVIFWWGFCKRDYDRLLALLILIIRPEFIEQEGEDVFHINSIKNTVTEKKKKQLLKAVDHKHLCIAESTNQVTCSALLNFTI